MLALHAANPDSFLGNTYSHLKSARSDFVAQNLEYIWSTAGCGPKNKSKKKK